MTSEIRFEMSSFAPNLIPSPGGAREPFRRICLSAATVVALAPGATQADDGGIYSDAQAARGEALYQQHCAALSRRAFGRQRGGCVDRSGLSRRAGRTATKRWTTCTTSSVP